MTNRNIAAARAGASDGKCDAEYNRKIDTEEGNWGKTVEERNTYVTAYLYAYQTVVLTRLRDRANRLVARAKCNGRASDSAPTKLGSHYVGKSWPTHVCDDSPGLRVDPLAEHYAYYCHDGTEFSV